MRSGRFSLRLFYVGAALVLFWLQESCCYVAILSVRALRPRFHATSSFFLNQRISQYFACFCEFRGFTWISQPRNHAKYHKPWAASFTLYKLATKNLHLATIFLQVVTKRRPENFVNFKPCLIHCNVLDRKETFFANNSNSPKSHFSNNFGPKMSNFFVVVSGQNKTGNNVEWLSR